MIKRILRACSLALGVFALLAAAPSTARTLDEILSAKKIVVGVNPSIPPLALYNEKNELDGFDVDFAKQIAEMLGVELELVKVTANDRIPFLTSGKIDFVLAAMTRTSARAKVIDFTVPVHTEALAVLTMADKPYKDWKDLNDPNVRLVSVRGTTGANFIQQNLPKAKLTLLDDQPENVTMIAQGRADAAVSVVDYLGQQMNKHKVSWKVLPAINISYCSAGIARGNSSLRDWMNVAIFELQTKGWLDGTWKKWFGREQAFPVQPNPYF